MKQKNVTSSHIYILMGVLVLVIGIFSIFQIAATSATVTQKITDVGEASRPADLSLIIVTDTSCSDCTDIGVIVDTIRDSANVVSEKMLDFKSVDAQTLLAAYSITKIPTIVLQGEVDRFAMDGFENRGNSLVFEPTTLPYTDVNSGDTLGRVEAILLKDSSCEKCQNLDQVVPQLKQMGLSIVSEISVEWDSAEGQSLIEKYTIERLPTIILSEDLVAYGSAIEKMWLQVGSKSADGNYLLQQPNSPYLDVATGDVRGLVTMTVIKDNECAECYDTEALNTPILQRFGLIPVKVDSLLADSAEGEVLIAKYNIERIPTIILSSEAEEYTSFVTAWKEVGTVEDDGTYVFRKVEISGQSYVEVATGKIVDSGTVGKGSSQATNTSSTTME